MENNSYSGYNSRCGNLLYPLLQVQQCLGWCQYDSSIRCRGDCWVSCTGTQSTEERGEVIHYSSHDRGVAQQFPVKGVIYLLTTGNLIEVETNSGQEVEPHSSSRRVGLLVYNRCVKMVYSPTSTRALIIHAVFSISSHIPSRNERVAMSCSLV